MTPKYLELLKRRSEKLKEEINIFHIAVIKHFKVLAKIGFSAKDANNAIEELNKSYDSLDKFITELLQAQSAVTEERVRGVCVSIIENFYVTEGPIIYEDDIKLLKEQILSNDQN